MSAAAGNVFAVDDLVESFLAEIAGLIDDIKEAQFTHESSQVIFGSRQETRICAIDVGEFRHFHGFNQIEDIDFLDGATHLQGFNQSRRTLSDEDIVEFLQIGIRENAFRIVSHRIFQTVASDEHEHLVHVHLFALGDVVEYSEIIQTREIKIDVARKLLFLAHEQQVFNFFLADFTNFHVVRTIAARIENGLGKIAGLGRTVGALAASAQYQEQGDQAG